ncbi:MAG TPA: aminopeptidase P family protein [Syntrophomonas sp.]|jgi:Xaa-Pro aminopeptidase|nr:aminopeptidase P family protein [Syntrophomonas sp.]
MLLTPREEIESRIQKFQQELAGKELDGAVIVLNSDMFYLAGTVQNAQLFVPAQGEPVLMIRKSLRRGQEESPLKNVVPMKSVKDMPGILQSFGYGSMGRIGLEFDVLPVNNLTTYQRAFPNTAFLDVSPLLRKIRMIKSPFEIEQVRAAMRILDAGFAEIPRVLREGMREVELASYLEAAMRRAGLAGNAKMRAFNQDYYLGNVCVGSSGAMASGMDGSVSGCGLTPAWPQGAGNKIIKRNEVVFVDYVGVANGYCGDQTRVFCIGQLPPKMEQAFKEAMMINEQMLSILKPGTAAEEPYLLAVKIAEELGYKEHFLGYREDRARFVGHGVGLETDEMPVFAPGLKNPIVPGMVFALEPKFVFEEGAIGTESTYVMTEDGPECLSITPQAIGYIE